MFQNLSSESTSSTNYADFRSIFCKRFLTISCSALCHDLLCRSILLLANLLDAENDLIVDGKEACESTALFLIIASGVMLRISPGHLIKRLLFSYKTYRGEQG